ncbi:MAG: acyltransferase [Deltaproteobacteria bacterium]|nr:acyltransferase [Deltaproteobacteria bacterium]MBW2420933.1 acyltransferase [Deltaproteobacteria bacterium]
MSAEEAPLAARVPAVDYIKVFAIVAVVFTHSILDPAMGRYTSWDELLGRYWVSYHVPAFLAVSGFLYYRPVPIPSRGVVRRFARVLVPYLVASFVALALGAVPEKGPSFLHRLLTGNTQGTYYYIFLIAVYVPTIGLLSRLPRRAVGLLFGALVLYPVASHYVTALRISETHFWRLRDPLYPYVFFVGGWLVHMHLPRLKRFYLRFELPLCLAAIVGVVFYFEGPLRGGSWQDYLGNRMIYSASVLLLISAASGRLNALLSAAGATPAPLRFVATATYTIYLYHYLFIYPVRQVAMDQHWHPAARILCVALAAMAGGCAVAWLGRKLLGRRSKLILGV